MTETLHTKQMKKVLVCILPFPQQPREAETILTLWTNTRSTYHCNRNSFEFIFVESWQAYWPYIIGNLKITGNQPVVQVYRMHNGSPKLILGMSIVHSYDNVYAEWQFTWINNHINYVLIIFNKSVQQGIGAMITIFSVHNGLWKVSFYYYVQDVYLLWCKVIWIKIRRDRFFFKFFYACEKVDFR